MATIAENLQLLVDSSKAIEQAIISNGGEVTGGLINYADDISEMFGKDLSKRDIYGNRVPQTTANCYIVKETGTYKFPCVYGNAISKGAVNATAYTKNSGSYSHDFVNYKGEQITSPWIVEDTGETISSVQLSIADTEGIFANIKIKGDYIVFNVNQVPATGANGVISIKNSSGTIMWNWHIWVWSDDLTPVEITNATGFVYKILPVNLASKWESSSNNPHLIKNWYYQNGRSVPILGPSSYNGNNLQQSNDSVLSFQTNTNDNGSYQQGITNPTTCFVYNNEESPYWFGNSAYYNLWDLACTTTGCSDNVVVKTVYDPCPPGFKMPNGNTFTGFTFDNVVGSFDNGWMFKRNSSDTTGIFFPASGVRYDNGNIGNAGQCSNVWLSASESQTAAHTLYFSNEEVASQGSDPRSRAVSVRPVEE